LLIPVAAIVAVGRLRLSIATPTWRTSCLDIFNVRVYLTDRVTLTE